MSDFEKDKSLPEYESRVYEVSDEESTIFSAPEAHRDKVTKGVKLKKIITAGIALVLVCAIAITVAVLVPPLLNEDNGGGTDEIDPPIMAEDTFKNVDRAVLKRSDAVIEFVKIEKERETEDEDGNTVTKTDLEWALKEVDPDLTSYTNIDNTVSNYMEQHYTKKVSGNKNDGNDYGFDKPIYQVDFYEKGSDEILISLLIGNENPAKTGRYATTTKDDAVYYIAGASEFYHYQKNITDFANPESIPAISKAEDYSDGNFTEGQLIKCDKLILSGNNFGGQYVIESQESDNVTIFTTYSVTSPTKRPANDDNVGKVVQIFSYGVTADGCYSYKTDNEELKKFGLDKPDFEATIYVGNIKRSFKATKQQDGNYAVFYEGNKTIMSVSADSIEPVAFERGDLFNELLFIENITNASQLKIESGAQSFKFDILTEKNEETGDYNLTGIKVGGKEITKSNFQNYYQFLVSITAQSYEEHDTKGMEPETVVTLTHKSGTKTVVKYFKVSSTRYQVEVNGVKMGLISSADHTRISKYAQNVVNEKDYNAR
ncbi:MAG: DUF4340 domain-containing protein [Clostridia bacterium]|nr:DUF4340 domain-containing protein [Clostridia bacterium]